MSEPLQSIGGVEFWKCLDCGKVRRIMPHRVDKLFLVPPEFCSTRCQLRFINSARGREYRLREQMSFGEICPQAVNE